MIVVFRKSTVFGRLRLGPDFQNLYYRRSGPGPYSNCCTKVLSVTVWVRTRAAGGLDRPFGEPRSGPPEGRRPQGPSQIMDFCRVLAQCGQKP